MEELRRIFTDTDSRVLVGIGDDAAVVSTPASKIAITTDMAVENVHFRRNWATAEEIGMKITAANLADIYSMGATPEHLVVAVALTGLESMAWIRELARGIEREAQKCDVRIIGGDIVRGPTVTISITAFGEVKKPILRSGAAIGEKIVITNLPGWSAAGLFLLHGRVNVSAVHPAHAVERALAQFRAPSVRYLDALALRGAHAMSDTSDGLLTQGLQMADASGVKFEIHSSLLAKHPEFADLSALADAVGANVWDWIGAGGEDHVFLATGHDLPGYEIGEVMAGSGIELVGVTQSPKGFTHFN
ncbi:MAG: thiamine-phosphate kinase [Actinobacteria bacterium]|nr:thiamine-phosphate kinase [Actinomycetota bacterium]